MSRNSRTHKKVGECMITLLMFLIFLGAAVLFIGFFGAILYVLSVIRASLLAGFGGLLLIILLFAAC